VCAQRQDTKDMSGQRPGAGLLRLTTVTTTLGYCALWIGPHDADLGPTPDETVHIRQKPVQRGIGDPRLVLSPR
jgi:hypothetical protein